LEKITRFNTTRYRPKIHRENGQQYGRCTFYDKEKGCRIHEAKPMECKIAMGCKDYGPDLIAWFDIKYFFRETDPESVRQFKLYAECGGKKLDGLEHIDLNKHDDYSDLKIDKDWDEILGLKKQKKEAKK
ncbi:MAG: hypothetical protein HGA85_04995, partial [Nanoarchaeota archaeon]|nr:hypothetical protein [Nanoarchaeota archaeon]